MIKLSLQQKQDNNLIIPETLVAPDLRQTFSMTKEFFLYDAVIKASSQDGILWIPDLFINDGTIWEEWTPKITEWITSGETIAHQHQWIVGSAKLDILGNPRTASSHANGTAIDITPIWDDDLQIVDPDGAHPNLAWNMASLTALSHYSSTSLAWVVEGDHIHFSNIGDLSVKDERTVAVFTSLSPAYPISEYLTEPTLSLITNKMYVFRREDDGIIFAPIEDETQFLKYLGES